MAVMMRRGEGGEGALGGGEEVAWMEMDLVGRSGECVSLVFEPHCLKSPARGAPHMHACMPRRRLLALFAVSE